MPLIGKAIRLSNLFRFAFTLTYNGTTYSFDEKSSSQTVNNVFVYERGDESWYLEALTDITINFSKLGHTVDYCGSGGGGGGGGGRAGGYGSSGWGHYGGWGGGGNYAEAKGKIFPLNKDITLDVGGAGWGGSGGTGSGTSASGTNGVPFNIIVNENTLLTATGGGGGGGASSVGDGGGGGGGANRPANGKAFGDDSMPSLGAGGGSGGTFNMDYYTSWTANNGGRGGVGYIFIRSTPKE